MIEKRCLVAINSPVGNSVLTYILPESKLHLAIGTLVHVPLGKRQVKGCLISFDQSQIKILENIKLKPIGDPIENEYQLDLTQLEFYKWISRYYHYPLGLLIFETLPKSLKRPRALGYHQGEGGLNFELSEEQKKAVLVISNKLQNGFSKWLLHGVTGSGKSVVFLELIKKILLQKKTVLYLLPEINLTIQFIDFFKDHLDCKIYSYNSSISHSDKYLLWDLVRKIDEPALIIGVRSSIFLPIHNLGLIVIDEEHDQSFKQDERCPYNARDIAIKKASMNNFPIVLGSATPTVDTFEAFTKGPSENYISLKNRVGDSQLPLVRLVDIRSGKKHNEKQWPLKNESVDEICKSLEAKKQVLVFVNKLGYAGFLQCRSCGKAFDCPNCSISLRVYKKRHSLECHLCDLKIPLPEACDKCGNMVLLQKGFGTEKVKDVLEALFPESRVERFDRDEVTTMKKVEERLREFHSGEIDILVGTQMLSKGHNFKKVNLVVILGIDSQLNFPDYKSHERVYQQLTQVSGRSGRFDRNGQVIIQTLNPENEIFSHVKNHTFSEFYDEELEVREQCHCPPYNKLVMIYVTGKNQSFVSKESQSLARSIELLIKKHFNEVAVLGPRPALVEKRVNKYTWAILLKSPKINQLHNLMKTINSGHKMQHTLSVKIDVDPYFLN